MSVLVVSTDNNVATGKATCGLCVCAQVTAELVATGAECRSSQIGMAGGSWELLKVQISADLVEYNMNAVYRLRL